MMTASHWWGFFSKLLRQKFTLFFFFLKYQLVLKCLNSAAVQHKYLEIFTPLKVKLLWWGGHIINQRQETFKKRTPLKRRLCSLLINPMAFGYSKAVLLHNDKKNEILGKIWEEMSTHLLVFALLAWPVRLPFRTKMKNAGNWGF